MSSFPASTPALRGYLRMAGIVLALTAFLVVLGFFVPLWLTVSAALLATVGVLAARSLRAAARRLDVILQEELGEHRE